ncbi:gastrula zinc finger protein XlCGF52.1-like [Megalops cyprinoides]|uniref:gastrula zinc finger protein XlCGF52.1-like n=1 Tax=Megalops cyprinoides TaxID=118141 RepID=UPI001864237F|nr:gastrula zinc finger protein XlCGF52.1-like [Megalops cyprinoides]
MEFESHVKDIHPEEYVKTARTKCGTVEEHEKTTRMEDGDDYAQTERDSSGVGNVPDTSTGNGAGEHSDGLHSGKGDRTEKRYLCGDCGKHFRKRYNLRRHQESHARVAKLHKCTVCGKSFSRPEHLVWHRYVHTGDPSFTCEVCGQHFRDPGKLRNHQKGHPELQMYSCKHCHERFGLAEELSAHKQGAHARQTEFPCKECDKCFSNLRGLRKHQQTHSKQRRFLCSHCGKGFGRLEHLRRHEHVHSSEKPHACAVCGKTFKHKEDLRCHSRKVHAVERKVYQCPQCQVCLHAASAFRRHLLRHTGQYPHACHICGKGFLERYHLKRHHRVHTEQGLRTHGRGQAQGPEEGYECPQCKMQLGTAAALRRHCLTHTGLHPHTCSICTKGFLRADTLRKHLKVHTAEGRRVCKGPEKQVPTAPVGSGDGVSEQR